MRYSGIGGQAVMEGVMMRNGEHYAVAVRKPDGEVIVDTKKYKGILPEAKVKRIPFVRGVVNFIDSLLLGMRTLMYSASFYEDGEEEKKTKVNENLVLGGTAAVSILAAVVIFMLIPYFISVFF